MSERTRIVALIWFSSVFNTPILRDVSTVFSSTSLLRITPFGSTFKKWITRCVLAAVKVLSDFSVGCKSKVRFGSISASSAFNKTAKFSTALFSWAMSPLKFNVANASRGIALRIEPPRISLKRKSKCGWFWESFAKKRASTLIALARPVWISQPECPPRNPLRIIW